MDVSGIIALGLVVIFGGVAFLIRRLKPKTQRIAASIGAVGMVALAFTIADVKPFYASLLCLVGAVIFFRAYLTERNKEVVS